MPKTLGMSPELSARSHDWARRIMQMEMKRHSMTYPELVKRLNEVGVDENERNLRNKVGRGEFSAAFMLVCMKVMGAKAIPVEEWGWGGDEPLTTSQS
ncbi:MAG TPA: DUF6471 domain-containing protein [Rhizomicrobium sp.]|jgi:hypothetical protein|nr:DUF6471 domain-containing protein [Rhizomicrobium sp.]